MRGDISWTDRGACKVSLLLVTRRDPALPDLDTVQQLELHGPEAIAVWLDVGSLELLANQGRAALSVQHRLTGAEFTLDYWIAETPA